MVDHEEHLWLVDHIGHTITKATKTGERLMMLCPHGVVRRTPAEMDEVRHRPPPPPPPVLQPPPTPASPATDRNPRRADTQSGGLVGRRLQAVGVVQQPAVLQSGKPFNKPTDICVDPKTGDLFITDGCVRGAWGEGGAKEGARGESKRKQGGGGSATPASSGHSWRWSAAPCCKG